MQQIYHILNKVPAIYKEDMLEEYENLVNILIHSGKLRIDTDLRRNFIIYNDNAKHVKFTVSQEEIVDETLLPETKNKIQELYKKHYKSNDLQQQINIALQNIRLELKKLSLPNADQIQTLARLFVQSTHPVVIRWLIINKVEVFITYSNIIGDVMDVSAWREHGKNSGMQSSDGQNFAIYVATGGDPLYEDYQGDTLDADGWCAIARLQIIAAHELGHFVDVIRDEHGKAIGRHSANLSGTRAKDHVKLARHSAIANCKKLLNLLLDNGLNNLISTENKLKFYRINKIYNFTVFGLKLLSIWQRRTLLVFARKNKWFFVDKYTAEDYMGLMLNRMLLDMAINLDPQADVYQRSDMEAAEAIACIETIARVPQQVMKWGHLTTAFVMAGLYDIYYKEIIPSAITSYEAFSKEKFIPKLNTLGSSFFSYFKKFKLFGKTRYELRPIREILYGPETFK